MFFLKDKNIYILLIAALLAHGLLLLNDGVYWDGWVIYRHIKDHNYEALYQTYKMVGSLFGSSLYWSLHYIDNFLFVQKLIVFSCIYIANIFLYLTAKRLNSLSDLECLLLGILSVAYSSYQVWYELIVMPYALLYAIFYVAVYLLFVSRDAQLRFRTILIRSFSIVLFLISFSLSSLLVYYYAVILLYYTNENHGEFFVWKRVTGFVRSNVVLIVSPIVYWTAKVLFYAPSGYYSAYNKIIFDPVRWAYEIVVTLKNSVNVQLSECIANLIEYPLTLVVVGLLVSIFQVRIREHNGRPLNAVSSKWMLVFGVIALILAIFPYAAILTPTASHGWATRHSLLMGVPVAIIIIAVIKIVWRENYSSESSVYVFLIMTLVAGFMITDNKVYVLHQVRWVKDSAFIYLLRDQEKLKNYSMYLIHDNVNVGLSELYRGYEYSSMFKEAWGGESRYGIDMHNYDNDNNKMENEIGRINDEIMSMSKIVKSMFILSDYQPTNKIINIYMRKKARASNLLIFLKYYYYKFVHPDRMEGFLDSIVSIKSCPFVKGQTIQAVDECLPLSEK